MADFNDDAAGGPGGRGVDPREGPYNLTGSRSCQTGMIGWSIRPGRYRGYLPGRAAAEGPVWSSLGYADPP